jgi:uncharacterized membrane protein
MPVKRYQKIIYSVILILSLLWCAGILIAPLWNNAPGIRGSISVLLYKLYATSCHQLDSRSFHLAGAEFGVCSRCTSIYFGFLLGIIIYPFIRKLNNIDLPSIIFLLIGTSLVIIDAGLDILDILKNTFLTREITGAIIGFILPFYIIPGTIRVFHEFFKPPINIPTKNAAE